MASEYRLGSVKLGCAFIKHNYWYLLPSCIQSARLDFITSVPWKGIALCACSHTHNHTPTQPLIYPLIYALTTHRHTPMNNRVRGQWGPHRLRSSLGEHSGTSSNGNKKTHTPPLLLLLSCSVRSVIKVARGPSLGEGELCFSSALGLPWTCTGMIVGSSHSLKGV